MLYNNWFRPGIEGLKLYSQIHGNNANQIIHGIGMPIVAYAVFGLSNFHVNTSFTFIIYFAYFIYYSTFDTLGALFSLLLYFPSIYCSIQEYYDIVHYYKNGYNSFIFENKQLKMTKYYINIFWASVVFQELIGHFVYERANSDLLQLPNSITQAPLFASRALLHNLFNLPLIN